MTEPNDNDLFAIPFWVVKESLNVLGSVNSGFVAPNGKRRVAEIYLALAAAESLQGTNNKEASDGGQG